MFDKTSVKAQKFIRNEKNHYIRIQRSVFPAAEVMHSSDNKALNMGLKD